MIISTAVRPYQQTIKVYKGKAKFQDQQIHSTEQQTHSLTTNTTTTPSALLTPAPAPASAPPPRVLVGVDLPDALSDYRVIVFVTQLHNNNYQELVKQIKQTNNHGTHRAFSLSPKYPFSFFLFSKLICYYLSVQTFTVVSSVCLCVSSCPVLSCPVPVLVVSVDSSSCLWV
jgi:hypothetical protein